MKKDTSLILSLYPNARGLGYASIEPPQKLLDSGIIDVRPVSDDQILARITKFVEFHRPTLIIVRDSNVKNVGATTRVQKLINSIADFAAKHTIPVHKYSRQQIRDVFEQYGATSKYEIAKRIIPWYPELAPRAPKIRKTWMDEDYNMCVFDAISLAVTHLYLTK